MNTHVPQKEAPALSFIISSGEPLEAKGLLLPALVQHRRVEIQVNPLNPEHNPLREQLSNVGMLGQAIGIMQDTKHQG